MRHEITEASYPLDFRKNDAITLGKHIRHRHSVELVGMKRVGISNFLRFFLYHKQIVSTYINHNEQHLFIPVDLNDLIEREIFPFWRLTFKRILDSIEHIHLDEKIQKKITYLFNHAIQSNDLFLTIDGLRDSLKILTAAHTIPTIFFIRFDRLRDRVTHAFFDNLQGLRDATHHRLAYVFTSFRPLDELAPSVFERKSFTLFSHLMYLKPAQLYDSAVIFEALQKKYQLAIDKQVKDLIIGLCAGHAQYLQLAAIIMAEKKNLTAAHLKETFAADERLMLQSEELWDNLNLEEQRILIGILQKQKLTDQQNKDGAYLFTTGYINRDLIGVNTAKKKSVCFSDLFLAYLTHLKEKQINPDKTGVNGNSEFTKKELLLFETLKKKEGEIAEREEIVSVVWSEYSESGVSDWAVDRLVARVRAKLKKQNSPYEIQTVKTRGYKLMRFPA